MMATNVGIRRARGAFILSTNFDIIFSDRIFESLKNNLDGNTIYTAIRYDVPHKFPDISNNEKIKYAKKNYIRIHLHNYTLSVRAKDIWRLRVGGKIYCLYRIMQIELKKILSNKKREKYSNNFFIYFIKFFVFQIKMLISIIFKINKLNKFTIYFSKSINFLNSLKIRCLNKFKKYLSLMLSTYNFFLLLTNPKNPHTNACGDFTLCSKEVWLKLRGYPEWDLQSWHLDSVFIYQGKNFGYKTKVINGPIYHIEHSAGSGFTPEYQEILFNRFRDNKIPYLSNEDLKNLIENQIKDKFTIYNDSSWGLNNDNLIETNPINQCN